MFRDGCHLQGGGFGSILLYSVLFDSGWFGSVLGSGQTRSIPFGSVRVCSIRLGSARGGKGTKDNSTTSVLSKRVVETSVASVSFFTQSRDLTVLFPPRGPHTPIVLHKQELHATRAFVVLHVLGCFFEEVSLQKKKLSCVDFFRGDQLHTHLSWVI